MSGVEPATEPATDPDPMLSIKPGGTGHGP